MENQNAIPNTDVYRIFNLQYLLDDIDNEVITFAHPSCFDDIKEHKELDLLFVQSWTKEPDLPAMWDIYSKNHDNIMIKFNATYFNKSSEFTREIMKHPMFKPFSFHSYWKDIVYDFEDLDKNENIDPLEYIFHKRNGYEYEKECRWVIDLQNYDWLPYPKIEGNKVQFYPKIETNFVNGKYKRILKVPFSKQMWQILIDEIIIDPRANDDYFQYIRDIFTLRLDINIKPADKSPIPLPDLTENLNTITIKRSTYYGKSDFIEFNHLNSHINKLYYLSNNQSAYLNKLTYTKSEELNLLLHSYFYNNLLSDSLNVQLVETYQQTKEYQFVQSFLSDKKDDLLMNKIKEMYVIYFIILKILKQILYDIKAKDHTTYLNGKNIFLESLITTAQEIFTILMKDFPYVYQPKIDISDNIINDIFTKLQTCNINNINESYIYWRKQCFGLYNIINELSQDITALQSFQNKGLKLEQPLITLINFLVEMAKE